MAGGSVNWFNTNDRSLARKTTIGHSSITYKQLLNKNGSKAGVYFLLEESIFHEFVSHAVFMEQFHFLKPAAKSKNDLNAFQNKMGFSIL
jgi:hypothetical protein